VRWVEVAKFISMLGNMACVSYLFWKFCVVYPEYHMDRIMNATCNVNCEVIRMRGTDMFYGLQNFTCH
jgi:hypothetical protein